MTVVATELGVNTLEGRITVGLRLLDTVGNRNISDCTSCLHTRFGRVRRSG